MGSFFKKGIAKNLILSVLLGTSGIVLGAPLDCGTPIMDIRSVDKRLQNKNHTEQLDSKTCEIIKETPQGIYTTDNYRIEIVDRKKIDDGLSIHARVWNKNGGEQIGFGNDGTVDIERFNLIMKDEGRNSAVSWMVVEDPRGPIGIDSSYVDIDGSIVEQTTHYREDPQQAILDFLEGVIDVKQQKFGPQQIVRGKIGNTTTSVTADAADGRLQKSDASWTTTREATTSIAPVSDETEGWIFAGDYAPPYIISRHPFSFDTSSIPATDTIDSATLEFRQTGNAGSGNREVGVVQTTIADANSSADTDYDEFGGLSSITEGASRITWDAADTDRDYTLNASGLSWIKRSGEASNCGSTNGYSCFGLRGGYDIDNTTPTARNYTRIAYSEHATAGHRPTLVVEHTAAAATTETADVGIIWFLSE